MRGVSFCEVAFLLQIVKTTLNGFGFISLEFGGYHVHQLSFNYGVRYSAVRYSASPVFVRYSGSSGIKEKKNLKYRTNLVFVRYWPGPLY